MKRMNFDKSCRWLAGFLLVAGTLAAQQQERQKSVAPQQDLMDGGKSIMKYVIEVPAGIAPAGTTDPAKQVGLVICSQEHDNPTGNDIFPVRQTLIRLGMADNYVFIAPEPTGRKFGPGDHEPIEKLIAWAKKTYPINPRRVFMFGKGEGSKISMEFTMTHPNLSAAAVGYSWGAWLMPSETKEAFDFANSGPEIYLTLGRRDLDNHLSCVRDAYPRLAAKGYHFIYREFDELGDRTYHPISNDDALTWATRLRNKNIAPSAEEAKLLKAFGGSTPAAVNGYYPTLALVGGAPAGAVLQKLFESKDANVRLAAAETCLHGIYGDATTAALAKLVSDPSDKVRRTAIQALGQYADWRYGTAQQALIALATDTSANPTDRLNATDALGYAVRLQVKGVRQDPEMFKALVTLQQDKQDPVKTAASLILAPVWEFSRTPPANGERPRRGPAGGWDAWLNEITDQKLGHMKSYEVCAKGSQGGAIDLFCAGGSALMGRNLATGTAGKVDVVAAFQNTLKAAEQGYVPAQTEVGMLYANGRGVEQNWVEAGKWWIKAGDAGDKYAARFAFNLYGNGEGSDRNPTLRNQMAKLLGEPIQQPRAPRPATPATSGNAAPSNTPAAGGTPNR